MGAGSGKKNFILIGAAGYVAPRHMAAIKAIGGDLIAAYDPHDSVGILDSYFPGCRYFQEFERIDRWVQKTLSGGDLIDFVAICSPNHLHDAHARWAMRIGADAICEKPIVLNERNLDQLREVEYETGNRVWAILQLRHHPGVEKLKAGMVGDEYIANIKYHTPRGAWYAHSWKGDPGKSGGVATNIGIHLFDLCGWLLGDPIDYFVNEASSTSIKGAIHFAKGGAYFDLSIETGIERVRNFEIDGVVLDLSAGFESLHVAAYDAIMHDRGFGIDEARPAIRLIERIREKTDFNQAIADLMKRRGAGQAMEKKGGSFLNAI